MDQQDQLFPYENIAGQISAQLLRANQITVKYGLTLSDAQIQNLAARRIEALQSTGRVELGGGVLHKLATAFCDSPYIDQLNYEDTLSQLQDMFYAFKNESMDRIGDDELIDAMKKSFDGVCQGSLNYLRETEIEKLCRQARFGNLYSDDGEEDSDEE